MGISNHGQYLTQITRLGAFNCYLVHESDGLTLIDTNLPGSAKIILAAAKAQSADIRRIVLTHAHGDHAGSLEGLHKQLPNAEIMISKREAPFLAGNHQLLPAEPQNKPRGNFLTSKVQPTRLLEAGEQIGSLQVIATPGHTPGHIALFDPRDGNLIAGDALGTIFRTAVTGEFVPLFPFPAFATWHKPYALESAKHLLALEPNRLAVGHGKVLEQPQALMKQAILRSEMILAKH
jgi:glyoxylase-like metal-dependent hydrolase (beta-lactamase superfamily II)